MCYREVTPFPRETAALPTKQLGNYGNRSGNRLCRAETACHLETVEEGTVENGDIVVMDFTGYLD